MLAVLAASCGGSPTSPPPGPRPLTLACPANVEVPSAGGVPVPVNFATPTAAGGTGSVAVSCTPVSGAAFASGSTPVTCTATDGNGARATCAFAVAVRAVPELSRTRFLAFGDSLTEGKLSVTLNMLIDSPGHSYPAKLQQLLRDRYTTQQPVVLNDGFGGEVTSVGLNRLAGGLREHKPEALLLMHGVNDLNSTAATGVVQSTVEGIEELTKRGLQAGIPTFVATLPPLGPGGKANCPECVEPLNERIRSMVAAKGAILVDVHAAWGNQTGLMGADGIHPTEAGYQVIANTFFEAIRRTLERAPITP